MRPGQWQKLAGWLLLAASTLAAAPGAAQQAPGGLPALWAEVPANTRLVLGIGPASVAQASWLSFVKAHHLGVLAEEAMAPRVRIREAFGIDPFLVDDLTRAGLDPQAGVVFFFGEDRASPLGRPHPSAPILLARIADPNTFGRFAAGFAAADESKAGEACRPHAGARLCQTPGADSWATTETLAFLAPKHSAASLPAALSARAHRDTLLRRPAFARTLRVGAIGSVAVTAFVAHPGFARCQDPQTLGSLWTVQVGSSGADVRGQLLASIDGHCLAEGPVVTAPAVVASRVLGRPWLTMQAASLPQCWQALEQLPLQLPLAGLLTPRSPADLLQLPSPWPAQLADPRAGLHRGSLAVAGLGPKLRYLVQAARAPAAGPSRRSRSATKGLSVVAGSWQLASNDAQTLAGAVALLGNETVSAAAAGPADAAGTLAAVSPPLARLSVDLAGLAAAYDEAAASQSPAGPLGQLIEPWLPLSQLLPRGPVSDRLEDAAHLGGLEGSVWREQDQLLWQLQQRPQRLSH